MGNDMNDFGAPSTPLPVNLPRFTEVVALSSSPSWTRLP